MINRFQMKRILAITAAVLALWACSKTGPQLYSGYYSFKTGGTVEITGTMQRAIGVVDTTIVRHVVAQSGQMHILPTGDNTMKVTLNITAGDPLVLDATVVDNTLILKPALQRVAVTSECTLDLIDYCYWEVSGTGTRYQNMVLFDLFYAGEYNQDGMKGIVTKSEISCIATENE